MSFALSSEQLMCMIKCDPLMRENVLGVFPADQLQRLNVGQGLILNTKPHHHPGEHWLAIYNSGNFVEVFDSLAALTDKSEIDFKKIYYNVHFNKRSIQCFDSLVCGHYSIFYLFLKVRDISFQDFLDMFSPTCEISDDYVYNFINRKFHLCLTNHV